MRPPAPAASASAANGLQASTAGGRQAEQSPETSLGTQPATTRRARSAAGRRSADTGAPPGPPATDAAGAGAGAGSRKKRRRQPQATEQGGGRPDGPGIVEKLGTGPPLRLMIVGHNPSETTWRVGHVYAHPANWMWRILIKTGIAPPGAKGPEDDDRMPNDWGVGFTDLGSGHPGTASSDFSSALLQGCWRAEFYARLCNHLRTTARWLGCSCGRCGAPDLVAFSGKRMYVELLNAGLKGKQRVKSVEYGVQQRRPNGWPLPASTAVWVCPSTSGAAVIRAEEREAPYAALAQALLRIPWPRPAPQALACRQVPGSAAPRNGQSSEPEGQLRPPPPVEARAV